MTALRRLPDRDPADQLLQRVIADLEHEFRGKVPHDVLVGAATHAVAGFAGARVEDFVPVLAWRRARKDVTRWRSLGIA